MLDEPFEVMNFFLEQVLFFLFERTRATPDNVKRPVFETTLDILSLEVLLERHLIRVSVLRHGLIGLADINRRRTTVVSCGDDEHFIIVKMFIFFIIIQFLCPMLFF